MKTRKKILISGAGCALAPMKVSSGPYVEAAQKQLNPAAIRLFRSKSRPGIALAHGIERLLASRTAQRLLMPSERKRAKQIADDFVFPDYPKPSPREHGRADRTEKERRS